MPICELCYREVNKTTQHHLVPREHGGRQTIELCSACHNQVHVLYTNDTLAGELNSLEALRQAPEMRRFLRWIRKQRDRRIKVDRAREKR
jgi:hypothetical protein